MKKKTASHPIDPVQVTSDQSGSSESRSDMIQRLFNEHNETLLRFLRVRLQSDAEAHEVAQEAYVRLLKLDEPEAVSYMRAFLFKIASNLAVDRIRERQRAAKYSTLTFFDEFRPSTEDEELVQEKIRLVNDYINELPPKCRKAFLLNRLKGLSTAEIAKQMLLSDRMVRKYLARASEYCRTRLDEELGDHHDS